MKPQWNCAWYSTMKLARFMALYGGVVATVLYLLPFAGSFLEAQYMALSGTVRLAAVAGFLLVIAVWQALVARDHLRRETA